MHVFCINLDRSSHRLGFMRSQAGDIGFELERISAVDGTEVPTWLAEQFDGTGLLAGEIGCYASHLTAARLVVDRSLPYAVVCEDDAPLADDFVKVVRAAVAAAPAGWDFIHLTDYNPRTLVAVARLDSGHRLVRYTRLPKNTNAYVISNAGARKWLQPTVRSRPSDVDVRYGWRFGFDIVGVHPAVAFRSARFASDIDATGPGRRRTRRRKWSPGLASRLYGAAWQFRKVGVANLAIGLLINAWNATVGQHASKGLGPVVLADMSRLAARPNRRGGTIHSHHRFDPADRTL